MATRHELSEGSLQMIMKGSQIQSPIMQVLGSKRIASSNSDKERFRLLLSDGKHAISFAMITTQINDKVTTGELADNSIIQIKRYITSVINNTGKRNKRVLVILEMEILVPGGQLTKIGDPQQLPDNDEEDLPSKSDSSISFLTTVSKDTLMNTTTNRNVSMQNQLIHPISSLSPYQNNWVIKARVSNKSNIRTWTNSHGEGKLFNMDLIDESGEIKATVFRELVDRFYDLIEVDKVYYISKCQVKLINKQFNNLKNDFEMTFTEYTTVAECNDAANDIPQTRYDFISIDKIAHIEVGTLIDVIGICKTTSDVQTFQARSTGRELKKREVTVIDQSNCGVALTLWGNDAENFDGSLQPVIVIKGAKVGEFGGGKNISTVTLSIIKINPDILEAHSLKQWFVNEGMRNNITNISATSGAGGFRTPWINIKDVEEQGMGQGERGDYFQFKGTVLLYRSEKGFYKACPTAECKKKVTDLQNGMYRCEKCNMEFTNFKYLLLGSINVADWSGNIWLSLFASEAEKILGLSSQVVGEASENDPQALAKIAEKIHFKQFIFKCRAKMNTYNDETRLKTIAIRVDPINYKEYNAQVLSRIKQCLA
ncbi:hypothetical protein RN001_009011 [Aquatica leii]|uniref:Replication protein A subunit n=1 Tax=Aquatica leii TaxID=1421715 RepID=A0AAN7NZ16_9COLE|nr:hypothetical protein RN001_009011 [Aquatica leii]